MLSKRFGENLFDEMFDDMMRPMHSMEKALYGKHASKGLDKDQKDDKGRYIRRERYCGECSRSFYIGDGITEKDVSAKFEDGILKLSIPKKETKALPKPNQITIE